MKNFLTSARRAGFSLVEVLAAVAIIGIIVFIAIPNVVQSRRDAEEHFAIGRAEALRRSMQHMITSGQPREAHPTIWAPFVVVGEGSAEPGTPTPSSIRTEVPPAVKAKPHAKKGSPDWRKEVWRE